MSVSGTKPARHLGHSADSHGTTHVRTYMHMGSSVRSQACVWIRNCQEAHQEAVLATSELSGDADTARTERRPSVVVHARCSRDVLHGTAATMERVWPLGVPDRLAAPVRRLARSEVCRQLRTSNYRWGKPTIPPLWRLDSGGGAEPLVAKARGVTRCRLLNSR